MAGNNHLIKRSASKCVCVFLRQWCVWYSSELAVGERQEEVSWNQSSRGLPEGEEPI